MILKREFYARGTVEVAKDLLGCEIFVRHEDGMLSGTITETEAYCGETDRGCHASRGRTPRTEVMYGPPGFTYIYMIYGMYFCLNFVTENAGSPCAVLIRGIKSPDGTVYGGPGKTCRYLKLDKKWNGVDAAVKDKIWIERKNKKRSEYTETKRVGIDYAGEWKDRLWRFIIKN